MTRSEVIDLVHIDGTGEYVFSPALADSDMDWIDANSAIVGPIVAARKNAAGFRFHSHRLWSRSSPTRRRRC